MSCENDKLEILKLKLKHVTKQRLSAEREVLKLRNKERSLTDDLSSLKREIDYLTEQLEILKRQLTQNKHQISLIQICTSLENVKNDDHINVLNSHLKSFQELFDKEQRETELRMKEQLDKKAEYLEVIRQKEIEIAKENETQEKKIAAIEKECDVIERECGVLKKRNCAILLKLRKKLLEAENLRRKRIKQTPEKNISKT